MGTKRLAGINFHRGQFPAATRATVAVCIWLCNALMDRQMPA